MLTTSKLPFFITYILVGITIAAALATRSTVTADLAATSPAQPSTNASRELFVPVEPLGDVVALYLPFGEGVQTYIYYQDQEGTIIAHVVGGGPFTTGFNQGPNLIAQSGFSRRGTPIAAVGAIGLSSHVFYVTPANILGETRYDGELKGGSFGNCPLCIDTARFLVSDGSQVLYALKDPSDDNVVRVGFESAGTPGTISEAVTTNFGRTWQVAPFPN